MSDNNNGGKRPDSITWQFPEPIHQQARPQGPQRPHTQRTPYQRPPQQRPQPQNAPTQAPQTPPEAAPHPGAAPQNAYDRGEQARRQTPDPAGEHPGSAYERTSLAPSEQDPRTPPPNKPAQRGRPQPKTPDTPFTNSFGAPVLDDDNSKTVGRRGFAVLSEPYLIEKLAHFNRERIPERVVHAKGAGAMGTFKLHQSMSRYTTAKVFTDTSRATDVFVRFSTVIGGRGSADTARDPRGFAVKFYTEEGNLDIVGNHIPVFFIRDAINFPDVIHSLKPSPDTNLIDPERFWDFVSNMPEATNMITWLYSDYGTIKSYRMVDGFGVNTYVFINSSGKRHYIKYHWKSRQGIESITAAEAKALAGTQPDIAVEDLYDAIARGDYPSYDLYIQVMDPALELSLPFDPLDDTKIWPEEDFPLIRVGTMTLNKNPENFFAQVEQSAFCPANIVPGIEFSADKMLVPRTFGYADAHRYRIGPNFAQLPINKPVVPVANHLQDGAMAYDYRPGDVNYSPNTLDGGRPPYANLNNPIGPFVEGELQQQAIAKTDNFTQAGERYNSYSEAEKRALCQNIASELAYVRPEIAEKVLGYFAMADEALAAGVREAMRAIRATG